MSAWDLYWILRLDDIKTVLALSALAFTVVGLICLVASVTDNTEEDKQLCRRLWKGFLPVGTLCLMLGVLCPTTKDAAAMYVVPKLMTPEKMEQLSSEAKELYGLVKQGLQKWVEDKAKK